MTFPILESRVDGFAQFLTAILIFVFVLVLTYFTTRFIGNFQKSNFAYHNFEVIESFRITNGKYLQLVKIGEKYIVLGIGKDSVSKICEISGDDVKIPGNQNGISKDVFSDFLNKAKKRIEERGDSHDE